MTTNLTDLERAALAWRKADLAWHSTPTFEEKAADDLDAAEKDLRAAADRVLAADEVTG